MKRTTLAAVMGLGFMGLACANESNVELLTPDGLPLRTEEEQRVADDMEKNTLAEIDLSEGKMKFIEMAPGEVSILRQIRVGAEITRVDGESGMTLDQIFRAYAPGRDVPQRLTSAMARWPSSKARRWSGLPRSSVATRCSRASGSSGSRRCRSTEPSASPRRSQARSTRRGSSTDSAGSAAPTGAGASAWPGRTPTRAAHHRSNSATCGDTGAARVNFYVGGTLRRTLDVPYGQCWTTGAYHHSHGFLGYNNETGQKYSIPYAQGSNRFAGWNADNDQFISGF